MNKSVFNLTVLFEAPFWIGIFERETNGSYEVCKITFGTEPKDYEVEDYLLNNWKRLRFSPSIEMERTIVRRINPKKMQREIKQQLLCTGIGTKAQQALKLKQEQEKLERRVRSRERRKSEQDRQFALQQAKRKEKHRGH